MSQLYNLQNIIKRLITRKINNPLFTINNCKNKQSIIQIKKGYVDDDLSSKTCDDKIYLCYKLINEFFKKPNINLPWMIYHQRYDKKYKNNDDNYNYKLLFSGLGLGVVFCEAASFTQGN